MTFDSPEETNRFACNEIKYTKIKHNFRNGMSHIRFSNLLFINFKNINKVKKKKTFSAVEIPYSSIIRSHIFANKETSKERQNSIKYFLKRKKKQDVLILKTC